MNAGKKKFVIGTVLSIFVVVIMISSATAVPVLNKADEQQEINSEKNPIETYTIYEDEKKESLFNVLVELLNNEELRAILKIKFDLDVLEYFTYEDIEKAYEEGQKIFEYIDLAEMAEEFNKFLTNEKGKNLYQTISDFIKKDDEVAEDIESLSEHCEECSFNSEGWYPGAHLICGWTFFVAACFYIPFIIGYPLYMLTGILGSGLILPFVICFVFAETMGCFELYGIEFPNP